MLIHTTLLGTACWLFLKIHRTKVFSFFSCSQLQNINLCQSPLSKVYILCHQNTLTQCTFSPEKQQPETILKSWHNSYKSPELCQHYLGTNEPWSRSVIVIQQPHTFTAMVQRHCTPSPPFFTAWDGLAWFLLILFALHFKGNAGKHLKEIQLRCCCVLCRGDIHKNWLSECIFNSKEEKKINAFLDWRFNPAVRIWNCFTRLRSRLISPSLQTSNLRAKSPRLPSN